MNGSAVAKRYADAFLEHAKEAVGFDKGLEELLNVKDIFRDNPELVDFLESPEIIFSEKCEMIEKVFTQDFSQELRNFLKLLLKKGRMDKFGEIAEYARIKYLHGEKIPMVLETSYPLDTPLLETVIKMLEKKFNKKLYPYVELDAELLGGIRVTVGNTIIDGSVRRRLEDIRNKLMAVKVV